MIRQLVVRTLSCAALLTAAACRSPQREVVVYTSVEEGHAAPVFQEFSRRSGIAVRAVYGVEAASGGIVSRLAGERDRPETDVVWNVEFVQTMALKQRGLLEPHASPSTRNLPGRYLDSQGFWSCVGARCRTLLIQTRLAPPSVQASMESLLDPDIPSHRVGIAYPPSDSSAAHAAALYAVQGEDATRWFFQRIRARGVRVVDSARELRQMIADWQLAVGLADSDVACSVATKDAPIRIEIPDAESLGVFLIPSTVALIKGAPHAADARRLIDYLLSAETEKRLIKAGLFQFSLRDLDSPQGCLEGRRLKRMDISLEEVFRRYETCRADLEQIFIR
jgi:iron(III) transport system substrate-binding protein